MATLLVWHGYLLGGTGSNIYTANMVEAWAHAGHDVVLMCQERHPERFPLVDAWTVAHGSELEPLQRRDDATTTGAGGTTPTHPHRGTVTLVRADIGDTLPVYVLDRYEGFAHVQRFVDLSDDALDAYAAAYAAATAAVLERFRPDGALLNHAVMGPPALRPVLEAAGVPYVVKVHGSELEYAIAERPDRFVEPALAGLEGARATLVGSRHVAERLEQLLGPRATAGRVELAPPGVDLDLFSPARTREERTRLQGELVTTLAALEAASRGRAQADAARLAAELAIAPDGIVDRLRAMHGTYEERDPEVGAAHAFAQLDFDTHHLVTYVGKMIRQKGAQLLVAAMPLVVQRDPNARFAMVGFGPMREGLEALIVAIDRRDEAMLDELLAHGNALDGGDDAPLEYLPAFFRGLRERGDDDAYFAAARGLRERTIFTGLVGHSVLAQIWPLSRAGVVPSILAEAFGMVAAEAAACGCPPVVARHSGLASVAEALAAGYPDDARDLVSFDLGDHPIRAHARIMSELCTMSPERHDQIGAAARTVVGATWSWHALAAHVATLL